LHLNIIMTHLAAVVQAESRSTVGDRQPRRFCRQTWWMYCIPWLSYLHDSLLPTFPWNEYCKLLVWDSFVQIDCVGFLWNCFAWLSNWRLHTQDSWGVCLDWLQISVLPVLN